MNVLSLFDGMSCGQIALERAPPDMPALSGFGITFDIYHGLARNWYQSAGDVKRWADNGQPVDEVQT